MENEKQLELFDTTDKFGVDTHAAPKLPKVDKGFKARIIDPKNHGGFDSPTSPRQRPKNRRTNTR